MQLSLSKNDLKITPLPYRERFYQLLQGDLDFHGKNSTYSSHAIHAFPAKFPPQIPRIFIEHLTEPDEIILDPMMGSGTTLLEASLLNRRAIGIDIDPLALRISHTKLNPKVVISIEEHGIQVAANAEKRLKDDLSGLEKNLKLRFDAENLKFIDYWFLPMTQIELLALLEEIEKIADNSIRSFLLLNFSAIIITKSGGVSLALDLAHTRPHRELSKKIQPAVNEFRKRLKRNLQNISGYGLSPTEFLTAEGNIEKLPLANNCVDLIVTSPPYASNAIDYMRAHKFSLVWMGFPISQLGELRQSYIGGDAVSGVDFLQLPMFSQTVIAAIQKLDKKKAQVLHRYYSEMTVALGEIYRVLKPGKAAVVVVGNSIMRGVSTETDRCLGEIGKQVGFDLVHIGIRNLDRDKRMLPARKNNNGENSSQIEARMHQEYLLGFIKPEG
jgi:DNA modification methylase